MALTIRTTGIEDYLDGSSNIKMLQLGDPGVGKTRSSSFWPKPIFADIEAGRASISDRKVPYAEIHNSTEMLQFLQFLQAEEKREPDKSKRRYQTVVIDTIDGYSRKVQQEWLDITGKATFTGFEAWAYLDSKLQLVLTRLLNLDMNAIINVHFKEKESDEGTNRIFLQLKGDSKDTIFNDFDLVGFMGTYWEAVDGERVEKRGLTFHKTPDRSILKCRFGAALPRWLPITFAETDYTQIRDALAAKLSELEAGEFIEEIPPLVDAATVPSAGVVPPETAGAGALPAVDPKDMPLGSLDKPTLTKLARDEGVQVKGNALKSEIVKAIEAHRAAKADTAAAEPEATPADATPTQAEEPAPAATTEPEVTTQPTPDSAPVAETPAPVEPQPEATPVAETPEVAPTTETVTTAGGVAAQVDTETGELLEVESLAAAFDATVEEATPEPAPPASVTTPEPISTPEPKVDAVNMAAPTTTEASDEGPTCGICTKPLAGENQDWVRLSFIRNKKRLCNDGYMKAKNAGIFGLPDGFTCR